MTTSMLQAFVKGVSSSYFNVFGILIFLHVIPLHPYILKIKDSDREGTPFLKNLYNVGISIFIRNTEEIVLFCSFYYQNSSEFLKLSKINLNYIHVKNNPKLTWQATLLFELLSCQLIKICKKL